MSIAKLSRHISRYVDKNNFKRCSDIFDKYFDITILPSEEVMRILGSKVTIPAFGFYHDNELCLLSSGEQSSQRSHDALINGDNWLANILSEDTDFDHDEIKFLDHERILIKELGLSSSSLEILSCINGQIALNIGRQSRIAIKRTAESWECVDLTLSKKPLLKYMRTQAGTRISISQEIPNTIWQTISGSMLKDVIPVKGLEGFCITKSIKTKRKSIFKIEDVSH